MDILRALSSPNMDIRKKTLDISMDLITSRNIDEVRAPRWGLGGRAYTWGTWGAALSSTWEEHVCPPAHASTAEGRRGGTVAERTRGAQRCPRVAA